MALGGRRVQDTIENVLSMKHDPNNIIVLRHPYNSASEKTQVCTSSIFSLVYLETISTMRITRAKTEDV